MYQAGIDIKNLVSLHLHPYFIYVRNKGSGESTLPQHQMGAQWLSGRVLDSRPKGRGVESHRRHCVVSLSKNINPSLVLVQPRKTRPFITERLLMGGKESNQTKQTKTTASTKPLFLNMISTKMMSCAGPRTIES